MHTPPLDIHDLSVIVSPLHPSFSLYLDLVIVPSTPHSKLPALHLHLIRIQLRRLLLLLRQQRSVFASTRAALLDAAECHEAQQDHEDADGACDDADLGALGKRGPAVAHAGGRLDFLQHGGGVGGAASVMSR